MLRSVHGILLLNKPKAISSNHALQRVKRLFVAKKAGHTGSLDPLATGMLPICFGEATKFSQFLLESNKSYQVIAKLGVETTTGDSEGEVTKSAPVSVTQDQIKAVLTQFIGEISQTPPMYSAIKHQGKPLYTLARKGIEVERKSRQIRIFSLHLDDFTNDELTFTVHCSKGTYVRTLVEDIGKVLNCGAHVKELFRSMVSPYESNAMHTLESLTEMRETEGLDALNNCLLSVETSVKTYPMLKVSASSAFYLRQGQMVRLNDEVIYSQVVTRPNTQFIVRLHGEDGRFLGLGEVSNDGWIKAQRLISK